MYCPNNCVSVNLKWWEGDGRWDCLCGGDLLSQLLDWDSCFSKWLSSGAWRIVIRTIHVQIQCATRLRPNQSLELLFFLEKDYKLLQDSFCDTNSNPLVTGRVTFISQSNTDIKHCLELIIKTIHANFTEKTSTTTMIGPRVLQYVPRFRSHRSRVQALLASHILRKLHCCLDNVQILLRGRQPPP